MAKCSANAAVTRPACADILVVTAEKSTREYLNQELSRAGFNVLEATDAAAARKVLDYLRPDLMLLESLSVVSARGLLQFVRASAVLREIPVIVAGADLRSNAAVAAFEAGADDFVTTPYEFAELTARMRARLRKIGLRTSAPDQINVGRLLVNSTSQRVSIGGAEIRLTRIEYRILMYFIHNADRARSREELCSHIWGDEQVELRTIDVHVRRLRRALAPHQCAGLIQTVFGSGYRFSVLGSDSPPRYTRAARELAETAQSSAR